MKPLISIIVPIYNVAVYLERCIASILNQTWRNLQVILVDDGSTDDSLKICRKYEVQDDRVIVIHKKNAGLVSARKAGIQIAAGDFIGYVDGDDWIEPGLYKRLYEDMQNFQVDMVETAHFRDIGNVSQRAAGKIGRGYYLKRDILPLMLCDEELTECRLTPYVWSKLFKRKILLDIQMQVDERICLGEDAAVTYSYLLKCRNIYISDYAGYHYIQRKTSMSREKTERDGISNSALLQHLRQVFEKEPEKEILQKQLNQYAKLLLLLRQVDVFDRDGTKKILMPFGGIERGARVVLYGAGGLGQSIYGYLYQTQGIKLIAWVDQAYEMYREAFGLPVDSPQRIVSLNEEYDWILIAAFNRKTAEAIRECLINCNVKQERILWFTEAFINGEVKQLKGGEV